MKGPVWLVAVLVFLFEIIAFGLALGAMTHRSVASIGEDVAGDPYCSYTKNEATGMAAGAIILLIIGHVIVMGTTGCFCCGSGSYSGKARACAILSFVLAWFSFVIAELCLVAGARVNEIHTHLNDYGDYPSCKEIRKSVFAAASAFTFLTLFFSQLYYLSLNKAGEQSTWQDSSYKTGAPTINMTSYP